MENNSIIMAKINSIFSRDLKRSERSLSCFNANIIENYKAIPFAHEWTIENISELRLEQVSGYSRIESAFSPPNLPEYEFTLRLWPKGDDSADYISLGLHLTSSPTDTLAVLYKFSIIKPNNQKCNTLGENWRFNYI